VFSVAERETFQDLETWLNEVDRHAENKPIIIVGNKADLVERRQVSFEEANNFAGSKGLLYMEVSAKNHESTEDCFRTGAQILVRKSEELKARSQE
jgi:GTPase SAR1 family protein